MSEIAKTSAEAKKASRVSPVTFVASGDLNQVHLKPSQQQASCVQWQKLSEKEMQQKAYQAMLSTTGVVNEDLANMILQLAVGAIPKGVDIETQFNRAIQGFSELQPIDAIEGMLCSQALVLHAQGMDQLAKAANCEYTEHREQYYRLSAKLLRLFQETIEKLEKYRRKGQQTVCVEHVHVHQGGQAIVGNVQARNHGEGVC